MNVNDGDNENEERLFEIKPIGSGREAESNDIRQIKI